MLGLPTDKSLQAYKRNKVKEELFRLGKNVIFDPPINNSATWLQAGRRLVLWNKIDQSQQPAMYLVQHQETYERYGVGLIRRYLDMGFWCYAGTGDPDSGILGDDLLDIMESALEAALAPDDPSKNELTLGGLVSWVRITRGGQQFIRDPGDIDGQALLVLPVRILLP